MPSVTRKTGADRGARREEAQARLLAVVERLLGTGESYTEITIDRLITEAEVPRSTFYLFFADKAHLLTSLTGELTVEYLDACQDWWHLAPGAGRDDLRAALRKMYDAYYPHRLLMQAVIETASYDTNVGAAYAESFDLHVREITEHIRRGQAEGNVHGHLDPERMALWLTCMIERGLYQFAAAAEPGERDGYLESSTDIVWNVLYAGAR
ncbi:hypothetical protein DSM112329_03675 [Paraconexibacter sp. AEG42_29]|uniref:HTH-type transcriptional regulator EthR C-terminal domain-containing protein n=1 Tax=Paraconexibacter sp. AEG42_29 TaxID=2997339 RepID=A0AAU7AYT5_9ACTN